MMLHRVEGYRSLLDISKLQIKKQRSEGFSLFTTPSTLQWSASTVRDRLRNAVSRFSDSRQDLGLDIGFIDYFSTKLVNTLHCNAIADFYTLQDFFQPAVFSLVVAW
jgi:hypothetical protein